MSNFQWKKSDIDWFTERFKGEKTEITSRFVSQNYPRKKWECKPLSQDFRNLMRLIVQNKQARVTSGHVTSKSYRIRMISDGYPYIQELFDEIFFSHFQWEMKAFKLSEAREFYFQEIKDMVSDSYIQELLDGWNAAVKMYRRAFWIYNFAGADYDLLADNRDVLNSDIIRAMKDDICAELHSYVCQYKLFKLVKPEIENFLRESVSEWGKTVAEDYNHLFIIVIQADLTCDVLVSAQQKNGRYLTSKMTEYNKHKELLACLKDGLPVQEENDWDCIPKYSAYSTVRSFWMEIPHITNRPEVLDAYDDCEYAFLKHGRSVWRTLLLPTN
jgi:hypothetical protein